MLEFRERVALVTGAARGLGQAISDRLARHGARVFMVDRNGPAVEAAAKRLAREGLTTVALAADVTDEAALAWVNQRLADEGSRLDILINNAGGWRYGRYNEITIEDWHWTFDTNVLSVFLCVRTFAHMMIARRYGRIVSIASVDGYIGKPRLPHYAAAKAAVVSLTKSFAEELGQHEILVNAVAPGGIATETAKAQGWLESRIPAIPLRRNAEPSDIAEVVAFLASEQNRFVAGETIVASGGAVMV